MEILLLSSDESVWIKVREIGIFKELKSLAVEVAGD